MACGFSAHAQFTVPPLSGPVVDEAGVLSVQAETAIDGMVRDLKARASIQMQLLTVSSLGGLEIEQASIQVTDQWKLGGAKDDKGVLLMIAPTERKLRIEVGQGLEGQIPDVIASRIIREVITPRLKAGDMDGAAVSGMLAIAQVAEKGEFTGGAVAKTRGARAVRERGGLLEKIIFFVFVLFILIGGRGRRSAGLSGFLVGAVLGGMGRGGRGGGFGGGGGWGGGGGGFSGGGSSGSW